MLKELHKQKVIQFRVSGAFVPRAITSSISYLGGQPTSLQGTNKAFGLNYKGNKNPKISPGSSDSSLAHSPSFLHLLLSIALLLSRQTHIVLGLLVHFPI